MDINRFDDNKKKLSSLRIVADSPEMEALIEALLSDSLQRSQRDCTLSVICTEDTPSEAAGSCIYIGKAPKRLLKNQIFLERPLDIEGFRAALLDITKGRTVSKNCWSYDSTSGTVVFGDKSVRLSPKEGQLFLALLEKEGECVTREELDCALWNSTSSGNCTDVYICYLRKKLEKIAGPGTVLSVRGRGYMMKKINNN